MIRGLFQKLSSFINNFLQNSGKVLLLCAFLLMVGLILDSSLFRLWRLNRDSQDLSARIENLKKEKIDLEIKIKKADDPHFIELQAREKFDLAQEGDLVFVFADED